MYPGRFLESHPDKPAVILEGTDRMITYRQLEERSRQLSWAFREAGLQRGDVVAVVTTNLVEVYEIFWAIQRTGLYMTSVNNHLTANEAAYIVNDSGAKFLIVDATLQPMAGELLRLTPKVPVHVAVNGSADGYREYEEVLAGQPTDEPDDQPAGGFMLYSSGTTGFPKGIKPPLEDRQLGEDNPQLLLFSFVYGFDDDSVYLQPAPLYHAAPLRISVYMHAFGGTVVVLPKFDAEQALAAIEKHKVTVSQWVPTMFVRMLKLPEEVRSRYDTTSMKVAVHAAAPCPIEAKQAMIEWWGPIILEYYSATEGICFSFINSEEWLRKPGSVGNQFWIGKPHIVGDDGSELPAGETGVVYFENDKKMFEYHNDPGKTAATSHPEHPTWATVGDVGHLDDEGYLFLTDRLSFMIISGGVNIYPQEIENVLTMHPKVADVAVIGVPHPELGESTKAVVQLAPGVEASDETGQELLDYAASHLARYKVPRSVDFSASLPRSEAGKLMKKELHAKYRA